MPRAIDIILTDDKGIKHTFEPTDVSTGRTVFTDFASGVGMDNDTIVVERTKNTNGLLSFNVKLRVTQVGTDALEQKIVQGSLYLGDNRLQKRAKLINADTSAKGLAMYANLLASDLIKSLLVEGKALY